ncbi:restriction endonuclease [Methylobacterium sp. WL120]|uniref:restriction endonuclease n=1 Tax=Methylobacterium sp. WL120 TaxID=2603887 RepID=UPI001AEEE6B2|nr:restriction endonuclease [Methylobacterium sp. WL120]
MPALPDYQTLMLPVLKIAAEGETTIPKVVERIAIEFSLSPDQMAELLPSGRGIRLINNRAHWAKTYLAKAGLLDQPRRGVFRASGRGLEVLKRGLKRIDNAVLADFEEFRSFAKTKLRASGDAPTASITMPVAEVLKLDSAVAIAPPDERITGAAKELEAELRGDLLDRIFAIEPIATRARFFEQLVIRLLVAMGYGGGRDEAAFHTGGRGDGGVDGVIHQDALGLDPVYVQAKCYDRDSGIGPEKIQAFKGALDDKGATRGVFITTARFSEAAQRSGRASQKQIALIDGEKLAELMVRFNVSVQEDRTVVIKKLDEDFFEGWAA